MSPVISVGDPSDRGFLSRKYCMLVAMHTSPVLRREYSAVSLTVVTLTRDSSHEVPSCGVIWISSDQVLGDKHWSVAGTFFRARR